MATHIRPGNHDDLPFLRQMLYAAVTWRGNVQPLFEQAFAMPEVGKLLANWGRAGDMAFIAKVDTTKAGAAWLRLWSDDDHSYGYVASDVPELGIGVVTGFRRRGIGRKLLQTLLAQAHQAGFDRVSLSVERDNPALRLYQSLGFEQVSTVDNAYTMVVQTHPFSGARA